MNTPRYRFDFKENPQISEPKNRFQNSDNRTTCIYKWAIAQ